MKSLSLLALLPLAFAAGCSSPGHSTYAYDHWSARSIGPRIQRHFAGFDPERDGAYGNRFEQDMDAIGLTFQRHFFNSNPDNPFQSRTEPTEEPQ